MKWESWVATTVEKADKWVATQLRRSVSLAKKYAKEKTDDFPWKPR
jgi:hypothetical protein